MRFLYLVYGTIVLLGVTLFNIGANSDNSSWGNGGSGRSGWSSSGWHK